MLGKQLIDVIIAIFVIVIQSRGVYMCYTLLIYILKKNLSTLFLYFKALAASYTGMRNAKSHTEISMNTNKISIEIRQKVKYLMWYLVIIKIFMT